MSNKYISVFRNENIYIFLSLSEIYIYFYFGIRINIFIIPVIKNYIFSIPEFITDLFISESDILYLYISLFRNNDI